MSSQHVDLVRWWSDNWVWILVLIWVFGGGVAEWIHVQARKRRKAIERRRKYKIELARARAGLPYGDRQVIAGEVSGIVSTGDDALNVQHRGYDMALPAAVIPAPPGAQPVRGVPGPCRHEKIVPVITREGEVVKWICANWTRGCDAEFPAGIAVYEPEDDEDLEDGR
jgi:hypothetical protein